MPRKQNIRVTGRAGNKRIERAIPKLRKQGMPKDQATATAIRLESVGQLSETARPIKRGKPTLMQRQLSAGQPATTNPRLRNALLLAAAMPKKTKVRTKPTQPVETIQQLQTQTKRTKRALPKRRRRR